MTLLITKVYNACLTNSHFPSQWKKGKIIAIPKPKKDPAIPTNFRPISLLSNFGKILEKILLTRLNDFEDDEKFISETQFGFRKAHSTIQQVIRIAEKASKNFNVNRSTGMVMIDIEKAFDSVWHNGLIHKMIELHFPIYLTKFYKSFLTDREAFVSFKGAFSPTFNLPAGTPQGALSSPFLYNLFVHDIKSPKNCELTQYADDTAILCDAQWKNLKCIKNRLESSLESINAYFTDWKIKINPTKTEFIIFTRSPAMLKKSIDLPPSLNGQTLTWETEIRYLGVYLDSRLCYKQHIDKSIQSANAVISMLFCMFKRNSTVQYYIA